MVAILAIHGVAATVPGEEVVIALVASRKMEVRVRYPHREPGSPFETPLVSGESGPSNFRWLLERRKV